MKHGFLNDLVYYKIICAGNLLWRQAGKLAQQQAAALCDGQLGGRSCQVAFEGHDLLPLLLRNL